MCQTLSQFNENKLLWYIWVIDVILHLRLATSTNFPYSDHISSAHTRRRREFSFKIDLEKFSCTWQVIYQILYTNLIFHWDFPRTTTTLFPLTRRNFYYYPTEGGERDTKKIMWVNLKVREIFNFTHFKIDDSVCLKRQRVREKRKS